MADPNNTYGRPAAQELSTSEEAKYKKKCRDLKRRISEIETGNESLVTKLARTKRFIQRVRLERAFLLEKLEDSNPKRVSGSDGSPSPPPSPSLEQYSLDPANTLGESMGSPDPSRRSMSPPFSRQHTPTHETPSYGDMSAISHTSAARKGGAATGRASPVPQAKKVKVPKDPNAPKRPKNAFLLFCEIERDSVRAAAYTGNGETVDIARELGRVWAEMNDEARKPYRDMYEDDKQRYEKDMAAYEGAKSAKLAVKAVEAPVESTPGIPPPASTASPAPRVGGFTAVNRS